MIKAFRFYVHNKQGAFESVSEKLSFFKTSYFVVFLRIKEFSLGRSSMTTLLVHTTTHETHYIKI